VNETLGLSFANLGGLGSAGRGWRGAFRVAQRQAPLRGEGLGERGRRLPSEAGVGAVQCRPKAAVQTAPLFSVAPKGGTILPLTGLILHHFQENVAARRGVEPLFSG
jgi:hypothetical protein